MTPEQRETQRLFRLLCWWTIGLLGGLILIDVIAVLMKGW